MRYVIVDMDGASRAYFGTRGEVRTALEGLEAEIPGTVAELYVAVYAADGSRIRPPEPADEVLAKSVLDWSDVLPSAPPAESLIGGTVVARTERASSPPPPGRLSAGASTPRQGAPA